MNQATVRQWMTTKVIFADPHTRLHDALRMMKRAQIRCLPVVQDGELVGIVTKRGLLRADATTVMKDVFDQYRLVGNLPLQNLMTGAVITIEAGASMTQAAALMLENKITSLPVIDGDQHMVGIVTSSDLFRCMIDSLKDTGDQPHVTDWMTRDVQTIGPNTDLLTAQRTMGKGNFRALPVVQDGLLVGIVTRTDLVSAAPSNATSQGRQDISLQILSTPIRFIMTSSPLTVAEKALVRDAASLMLENKIHSLPVLSEAQELAGIITETDIFRLIVEKETVC